MEYFFVDNAWGDKILRLGDGVISETFTYVSNDI